MGTAGAHAPSNAQGRRHLGPRTAGGVQIQPAGGAGAPACSAPARVQRTGACARSCDRKLLPFRQMASVQIRTRGQVPASQPASQPALWVGHRVVMLPLAPPPPPWARTHLKVQPLTASLQSWNSSPYRRSGLSLPYRAIASAYVIRLRDRSGCTVHGSSASCCTCASHPASPQG